jgi:hypothetical protein
MQNTRQLLNAILDSGKTTEFMVYPGARHGVRGIKAVEFEKLALDFWKRKFFPASGGSSEPDVRPVGPVRSVEQEKEQ